MLRGPHPALFFSLKQPCVAHTGRLYVKVYVTVALLFTNNFFLIFFLSVYTGWPRKNATPIITTFKEIRDLIKLVIALMRRKSIFQQNYTKTSDFDEGVLILEPFF